MDEAPRESTLIYTSDKPKLWEPIIYLFKEDSNLGYYKKTLCELQIFNTD